MAQSAITVTPPNPTPPTNMSFTGVTGPNPPNYTKNSYINPVANPPPYFDDGAAGAIGTLAANTAALASGTGVTSGGTENTYPGTGTLGPNNIGAVPASTSVAHEGAGTEVSVTAPGSRAECPTIAVSTLGSYTNSPNSQHASSLSPSAAATITTFSPATTASGGGTFALTVNGTNFTRQSVVYVNGIAQTTVYVSPTQLTVAAAPKKATAGTLPVFVRTAGLVETAPTNYTFT